MGIIMIIIGINFRYDIILTSETIYNTASYPKLHKVFTSVLKKTGIMYPLFA